VLEKWRRARDSNPQGPRGPVDFKSTALPVEASPPCQEQPDTYDTPGRSVDACTGASPKFGRSCAAGVRSVFCVATGAPLTMRSTAAASRSGARCAYRCTMPRVFQPPRAPGHRFLRGTVGADVRRAQRKAGRVPEGHLCIRHPSAIPNQRHPRPVEDRGRADGAGTDGLRPAHGRRQCADAGPGTCRASQHHVALGSRLAARSDTGGRTEDQAGPPEPLVECDQVHAAGRPDRVPAPVGEIGNGSRTEGTTLGRWVSSGPSSLGPEGTNRRKLPDLPVLPLDVPSSWRAPAGSCSKSLAPRRPAWAPAQLR
jgi:hypothetical protein